MNAAARKNFTTLGTEPLYFMTPLTAHADGRFSRKILQNRDNRVLPGVGKPVLPPKQNLCEFANLHTNSAMSVSIRWKHGK